MIERCCVCFGRYSRAGSSSNKRRENVQQNNSNCTRSGTTPWCVWTRLGMARRVKTHLSQFVRAMFSRAEEVSSAHACTSLAREPTNQKTTRSLAASIRFVFRAPCFSCYAKVECRSPAVAAYTARCCLRLRSRPCFRFTRHVALNQWRRSLHLPALKVKKYNEITNNHKRKRTDRA